MKRGGNAIFHRAWCGTHPHRKTPHLRADEGLIEIFFRRIRRGDAGSDLDGQHLLAVVISAGRADDVRECAGAALLAVHEVGRVPTVRSLARALLHLGDFSFWNWHGSGIGLGLIRVLLNYRARSIHHGHRRTRFQERIPREWPWLDKPGFHPSRSADGPEG